MKQRCEQCGKQIDPAKARLDGVLDDLCGECALKSYQCFTLYQKRLPSGQIVYQTTPPTEEAFAHKDHKESL